MEIGLTLELGDVLLVTTGLMEADELLEPKSELTLELGDVRVAEVFEMAVVLVVVVVVVMVEVLLEMVDVLVEVGDVLLATGLLEEKGTVPSKDTCLPARPKFGG